jgi:hypothetical protein
MFWLGIGTLWGLDTRALIAASIALVPTIFMTRVRLEAGTLRAISRSGRYPSLFGGPGVSLI